MNYDKQIRRSRKPSIRSILIPLTFALVIDHAQAQQNSGDSLYIITNRTIDTTCNYLTYNGEVALKTKLSFLKVTQNKSDTIVSHKLTYDEFMAQLCTKRSDWLLFVHGDSKTYDQSIQRGFDIQNFHNINVIVFSWPSKDPDLHGLKNLHNSQHNVLRSMDHFNELLAFMDSFKKRNKTFNENARSSLLLHSLGNLYLENLVKEPTIENNFHALFENVIINSAAVDQKKHQDWVEKINFQKRIYITNNRSDFNLKGLHIFSKAGNQLGEKAKAPLAANAHYVHFSKAVGFRFPTGTTHTYFIGNVPNRSRNIRNFYFDAFHGAEIDFSEKFGFVKRKKSLGYDIVF